MKRTKQIGMVIKVKPEKLEEYKRLHADNQPGVRDLLTKYNIHNFSIFLRRLEDGQHYLFGTYTYTGDDYESDMKLLDAEPRNRQWLDVTDICQIPLDGEASWAKMEQVYFNA